MEGLLKDSQIQQDAIELAKKKKITAEKKVKDIENEMNEFANHRESKLNEIEVRIIFWVIFDISFL